MIAAIEQILRVTAREYGLKTGILTNNDLVDLTGGLRQGAAQIRWIRKALGIDAPRRVDGHPMITWEQVNRGRESTERKSAIKWKTAA